VDCGLHCLVQVLLVRGEGEEGDAVNGNFGIVGGRFKICEGVRVKVESG
jgi:hypothetical protein